MPTPSTSHTVHCLKCSQPFDATQASWCWCVTTERTPVCPHCRSCSCRAPLAYKQQLWVGAPGGARHASPLAAGQEPHEASRADAPLARPLVLVVDDEAVIRYVVRRNLEGLSCGLLEAEDGQQALRLAQKHKPELILTDMLLPKLSGLEVCRHLCATAATAHIKAIIMTGVYLSGPEKLEAQRLPSCVAYLEKPVSFRDLRNIVAAQLVWHSDRRHHPRFPTLAKVRLTRPDAQPRGPRSEDAVAIDIGKAGALVRISTLRVAVGDVLLFEMAHGRFKTRAEVAGITIGADNVPRLNLSFLDQLLPDDLLSPEESLE